MKKSFSVSVLTCCVCVLFAASSTNAQDLSGTRYANTDLASGQNAISTASTTTQPGGDYFDGSAQAEAEGNVGNLDNCQASCNSCGCRYFSILGGWTDLNRYVGQIDPPFPPTIDFSQRIQNFGQGWSLGGAVGRNLGDNRRSEVEFLYRNNSADEYTLDRYSGGVLQTSATNPSVGTINSYSSMINFFRDLPNSGGNIVPYIGGGFGLSYVDGEWTVPVPALTYSIDEVTFAWQLMTGLNFNLNPATTFFMEFRYFDTTDVDIVNPANVVVGDFNYENSSILAGFRFNR